MLQELACGPVPVINGGDADADPVGALADLCLFEQWFGALAGRRLTWVGDASGLLYDLLSGGGLGLSTAIAHPMGFAPDPERLTVAREHAAETGAAVLVTSDIGEATADASVVYVDVWPTDHADRFRPFAIQRHSLRDARAGVMVLHRRPEHRGPELSASFAEDVAAAASLQHRARVEACAAVLAACLRPDPLISVVG
jgi:ornithine carbamoyltransferase